MKKTFTAICLLVISFCSAFAQDEVPAEKKKVYRGAEGGVLFNMGYAFVNFPQVGYHGGGIPIGVGGRGFARLGDHFRVGGEGWMNTIKLDKKGSESRFAFGGAMADAIWTFGRVKPYIGFTIGGGILNNFYVPDPGKKNPDDSWEETPTYYNNMFVWGINPYAGMQITLFTKVSLIIQISYTVPFNYNVITEFNSLNFSIGLEFGG